MTKQQCPSYSLLKKLNNQILISLQRRPNSICEKANFDIVSVNGKTQFFNGQEVSNNYEEADTSIIRTLEQRKPINCNVIVHATDTDIFFFLLKHVKVRLCHNFCISLKRRFVNIAASMNKLSVKASYALLSLHPITGCNIVSKFNVISKEYWFKRLFENYDNHADLKNGFIEFQKEESLTEGSICKIRTFSKNIL